MTNWKKPFYTITAGQTISLIGSSAVQFAMIWWLAQETASPLMLGFSGLMAFLPSMLLGPFAGVWIDRLSRKRVAIAADLALGVAAAIFAALFLLFQMPYWTVCILLLVRAVGGVFHTPAIQAIVPMLVPKEELLRANGVSQFLQSGAFLLGPVLGALMFSALPIPVILLTDLVGALVASGALAIFKIPEPERNTSQKPHFLRELREGINLYRSDKKLLSTLICVTACMTFFMPLSSLYPLMTSSYFKLDAIYGGIVEVGYALGMLGAALLMGILGKIKDKFFVAYLGLGIAGAASFFCGVLPVAAWAYWVFVLLCVGMGAGSNLFGIPLIAYMQETIAPQSLGRALSLWGSAVSVSMPLGLLIAAPVAETFGVARWFVISGMALCVLVVLGYLSVVVIRRRGG